MNSSSENAQIPPTTTSTSLTAAQIREGRSFNSPIACHIIFGLQFMGADIESIFRVLQAYDLGGSIFDVAVYIKEMELIQHHEYPTPRDGRKMHTEPSGTNFMIDYSGGWPVRMVVNAPWIKTQCPRCFVSATGADERQEIITIVLDGQVGFWMQDWDTYLHLNLQIESFLGSCCRSLYPFCWKLCIIYIRAF